MPLSLVLATACAAAACSQASPVSPSAGESVSTSAAGVSAAGSATAADAAGAASGAAAADAPRRLVLPDGVCRVKTESSGGGGVVFRLAPGGAAFAKAGFDGGVIGLLGRNDKGPSSTQTELVLFGGQPPSAGMTFETRRIRVQGYVDLGDVRLHVAKASVLGGFLVPISVALRRVSADGLDAAIVLPPAVELAGEPPPWRLACADLSIAQDRPGATDALPAPTKKDEYMLLKSGAPIALSLTPGGAAVAHLHPEEKNRLVSILEKKGSAARVAWAMDALTVFGWVPASSLERHKKSRNQGEEGEFVKRSPREKGRDSLVCDKEVPLFAEVSGDRAEVGAILAGARIDVSERRGTFARVEPVAPAPGMFGGEPYPDVDRAKDASFWVRENALAGCSLAPAAAPSPPPPPLGAP